MASYTPAYRARLVAEMGERGLTPHQMSALLGWRPSATTLAAWYRESNPATLREAVELRRLVDRTGPITPDMLEMCLNLLKLDASEAAEALGAMSHGVVQGWISGDIAIPAYVAAHVRTLIRALDGSLPRLMPGAHAHAIR